MYSKYTGSPLLALLALSYGTSLSAAPEHQHVMTVTATKQERSLAETDSSILIKTGKELEQAGITRVQDLERAFPGFLIQSRGTRTYASTTIRGISSPDYYSPTVNIYVDGVQQDSAFLTQQLINVAHVELLRGPQGMLYGGNAQGGVINIITNKASEQPKAKIGFNASTFRQQLDLAGATVLGNGFYADGAVRVLDENGFIRHIPSDTPDANDAKTVTGNLRLHYLPENSPLEVTLSAARDRLDSHEEWYLTEQEFDQRATSQTTPQLDRTVDSYALSVEYDLGSSKLTSITSYQDRVIDRQFIGGVWDEDQRQISEELRLNTTFSDRLSTVAGLYVEDRELFVNVNGSANTIQTDTVALFGQAVYALTPTLDLTLGARGSHVKVSSDFQGNPAWMIDAYNESTSDDLYAQKVALGWQATDDTRLFASLTNGYRAGGFSPVPRSVGDSQGYNPEESLNAELGWRTSLFDHQLDFSGAFYWIETEDIQLYTGPVGNSVLRNLGDARSRGVELDLAWYPNDSLTMNMGATFGKSEFTDGNDSLDGNRLPYAPDTTLTASLEYDLPALDSGSYFTLQAAARYNDKIFFDEHNSLSQGGYTLVDLGLRYNISDDSYVRLYGNNITDEEYKTYSFAMGPNVLHNYGTDREIGLALNMAW